MEDSKSRKMKLTAIPTYPVDFFPHPKQQSKTAYLTPKKPRLPDEDVFLTQERDGYVMYLSTKNRAEAKKIGTEIARTSGMGSSSPKHHLLSDFSVTIRLDIILLRGTLDTLLAVSEKLFCFNYISKAKHTEFRKKIDGLLLEKDSDSESSDSASNSPRTLVL